MGDMRKEKKKTKERRRGEEEMREGVKRKRRTMVLWMGWDGMDGTEKQRNKETRGAGETWWSKWGVGHAPQTSPTNGTNQPKDPFPDWRSTYLPDGRWGCMQETIDIKLCSAFRNTTHRWTNVY